MFAWLYREYASDGPSPPAALLPAVAAGWILMASYWDVTGLAGPWARILASYVLFGALTLAGAVAALLLRPSPSPR